jgi:hypothetical protein
MSYSLQLIFCINLIFVLFPVLPVGITSVNQEIFLSSELSVVGPIISSILTPIIVSIGILSCLIRSNFFVAKGIYLSSLIYAFLMGVSVLRSDLPPYSGIFMAIFFVLFSLYLVNITHSTTAERALSILRIFKNYFSVWLITPFLVMIFIPSTYDVFVTGNFYHGFSISRVGFSLWAGAFAIFIGSSTKKKDKFIFFFALFAILLSQSRAAIAGLLIVYCYQQLTERGWKALVPLMLIAILTSAVLALWIAMGRQDTLEISDDRGVIYLIFIEYIKYNWLYGYGGMKLFEIMGFEDGPAHNLLIQWAANYGVLTLAILCIWMYYIFQFFKTMQARKLLIYLIIYSMFQPVQGTGNFFSPVTLLYFLIICLVEILENPLNDNYDTNFQKI